MENRSVCTASKVGSSCDGNHNLPISAEVRGLVDATLHLFAVRDVDVREPVMCKHSSRSRATCSQMVSKPRSELAPWFVFVFDERGPLLVAEEGSRLIQELLAVIREPCCSDVERVDVLHVRAFAIDHVCLQFE